MKKIAILIAILFVSCYAAFSQDTIYIYRAGLVITKRAVTEIDSITFYKNYSIPQKETVSDVDGNVYHTVTIGNQTWMVENLKTTKYRNGDAIGTTSSLYMDLTYATSPKYQWSYNGIESNVPSYGRLYTWFTATDPRNIAPVGWHVATDAEWATLQSYMIANGYNYDKTTVDNKIAKALSSPLFWNTTTLVGTPGNDPASNNSSGLSLIPNGYRGFDGMYYNLGNSTLMWTGTEYSSTLAYSRGHGYNVVDFGGYNSNKNYGFAVRCVKDVKALATVSTIAPSSITDTTAVVGGKVSTDGFSAITARGICWSTSVNPMISGNKTIDSLGVGSFTSILKGLIPNTTYYVRAYATNSLGTAYGNEVSFATQPKIRPSFTDIDGNVYHSVTIGTQTWMVENLKTTKYSNGDVIGTSTSINMDLSNAITPKYQWAYNGDETNVPNYGRLYTWYVVNDSRNIAPVGWHVATDAEWVTLQSYMIANGYNYDKTTVENKIAKSLCSTTLWNNTSNITGNIGCNIAQNNASGLTFYPAGYRGFDGYYYLQGDGCDFWTTTEASSTTATIRFMGYQSSSLNTTSSNKNYGFSVRCVKDVIATLPVLTTQVPSNITDTIAVSGGNISSNGGAVIIARGVCWSTSTNPTISGSKTTDSTGVGSFTSKLKGLISNTTYYVRAYATNSAGTSYGNEQSFKTYSKGSEIVTDIDGNVYHTVIIGDQTWMVENLRTTKLFNGLNVPRIQDGSIWSSQSAYAYCWYGNDSIGNKNTFGALYNWNAVSTRKLAPVGWHIPSKEEINTLTSYLGGNLTAGSKLKESGNTHWSSSNTDATNSTGFTALPGGYRSGTTGDYHYMGSLGVFWSSSDSLGNGGRYILSNTSTEMNYSVDNKMNGFSVRCIKDVVLPVLTTKSATAITDTTSVSGGNISSNGGATIISRGICWSTITNPTISGNKTSDSTGIGSFTSKLKGLIPNTTYYVRAYATNSLGTAYGNEVSIKTLSPTVSDIDGNIYHTVVIGTQTWIVENLKTTRYNNGDSIGTTIPATKDISIETTPKYQWAYAGNESNVATYGRLYSWYAATDSRKIAPKGWHVATDMEWTTVENFIKNSGNTAKALCANNTWGASAVVGSIGNDLLKNNVLGFNGLPSGYRNTSYFAYIKDDSWGGTALWWSASDDSLTNNAWFRFIDYGGTTLGRNGLSKSCGMAIRCIKD